MTEMTIDDELALIRKNRKPSQALQDGLQGLSDTYKAAVTPPAPEPPAPEPPAAPAAPAPKTPAEIDAELGLPPAETGLAPLPDDDAGSWDVLAAAWRAETIKTDAWNYTVEKRRALAEQMFAMLPADAQKRLTDKSWSETGGWAGLEYEVIQEAGRSAAQSPDEAARWARYPTSYDALLQKIDADRIADLDEAEAVLAQPGGGLAEFVGTAARAMTDETSLLLMPFGVSGAAWRVIASEAVLGAVGEAAVLPKEYRVARELGLPDPDAASRIGLGAFFGGGLAAGLRGLGRGMSALQARAEARRASLAETQPEGVDRIDHEHQVEAAEAELRGDKTPSETFDWSKHRSQGGLREDAISGMDDDFRTSLEGLIASAPPEIREGLSVFSGYRSIERQQELWDASDKTGKWVARPGKSKHNHGVAADLEWNGQRLDKAPPEVREWVHANAEKFGLHFPMGHEPWHIEPVGARGGTASAAAPNTPGLNYNEDAVLAAIVGVESSGNATARASTSSAAGLGQILTGTWLELIQKHRPDLMEGRTQSEILALRDDADLNAEMTKAYMRDNTRFLEERGIEVGPAEVYLAHFMGPGGAAKALKAAPETPISQLMSPKEIKANAAVRYNGKAFADFTAYDLRMWSASKMRNGNASRAGSDVPDQGNTSRGYTGSGQVAVGDDTRIDVDYEVVDYRALIKAAGDLQPRDRSRINSDEWVASTAARLDPAQLMPSPTADRGTPIVGPDNVIESGNGRSMAIARAYERHPDRAQAYRGAIEAAGYQIPDGVDQPVLIARRRTDLTPDQRRQFVIDAQDSGVAQMTPTEVARATARNLQSSILSRLDPTAPLASDANGDFVRAALATLPRSARNAMFDPGGALNALGQRQLKEAIFARAWPDPDILARYTEGSPAELKSLMEALETAAPSWAALKADIEAGLVTADMDISGFVLDAMRLIGAAREVAAAEQARRAIMPKDQRAPYSVSDAIAELLDEVDLIQGPVAPLTAALVRKMWPNGRAAAAEDVASFLTRYADEARTAGKAGGMFDAPGPRDVLRTIEPETFGSLPEDFGTARGFATRPTSEAPPEAVAQLPDQGFDLGARSPEAEATHAEIEASLRGDTDPPAASAAREAASDDPAATPVAERDSAPVAPDLAEGPDPIAAARDDLAEFADIEIDLPDGTRARAGDILDDLDADRAADEAINTCAINPAGAFLQGASA